MALTLKLNLKKKASSPPVEVEGPYRANHTPGRPDNEWEVRDDNGVFVMECVGSDFEVARKRTKWLARKLNEAYQRGLRERRQK